MQNDKVKNRIGDYLKENGIEDIRPNENILHNMDATIHSWYKWIRRKSDPQLYQLYYIADFLNCTPQELLQTNQLVES